ncbi:acetyl esterase/lipase [Stackebrandtia endophytica]|uniref:Acetyl esterase/lipase n=1 Tax=Stackebrandtia endophytica TaxID=1496996 RepID=A0A543AY51_9ACTN|nr:alpha/beta hydrolase [Stackebrandtia endophytica]TQL77502.1 acetyl esterase/lipase [Stackebrandtia endophytica]
MKLGLSHVIDPRLVPLADATRVFYRNRAAGPSLASWEAVRAFRDKARPAEASTPPAVVESAEWEGRAVPVRIHRPEAAPSGVLLNIHGGGFFLGSAADDDVRNRDLADRLGIAVVSVDYRLAPENPWPAAPDDCETAARWLVENATARFGTDRLAIGGFSAGSTLAVVTLIRLRERGVNAFDAAVLECGTYDLSGLTPAGRLICDEYFIQAYAGSVSDRTLPDISPIYADHTDLPTMLMIVGEDDILLRDNLAMAGQLSAAGVEVDLRIYPAAPHGFSHHPTPMAEAALDDLRGWLAGRFAPA